MDRPKSFKPDKTKMSKAFNGRAHVDALYKETSWVSFRLRFLKANPECYSCGVPATVVDHLIPHQGNRDLFEKADNMIPMCARCHNTITNLFDRYHTVGKSINDKLTWIKWARAKNELKSRVRVLNYHSQD